MASLRNAALYRAARRLQPADETDRQLLSHLLRDFEEAGVSLPPAQRARAKQFNDRMAALDQQFDRHIRDANLRVLFIQADLRGVPEAVWKDAKPGADGRLLLGVEAPTYGPVLQLAESAATRERAWRAKTNEGGTRNLAPLAKITRLRRTMRSCSVRPAGPSSSSAGAWSKRPPGPRPSWPRCRRRCRGANARRSTNCARPRPRIWANRPPR